MRPDRNIVITEAKSPDEIGSASFSSNTRRGSASRLLIRISTMSSRRCPASMPRQLADYS
jgi:hypothetical protein